LRKINDRKVAAVFDGFPRPARDRLMALRELIFETAEKTEGVGELHETLKWGEPAYLTPSKSGSTIRLGWKKSSPDEVAMYFICTTGLVDRFRGLYPRELGYAGNRAIIFAPAAKVPEKALRHCIALALTYHRK
jgi:hypothetical protein